MDLFYLLSPFVAGTLVLFLFYIGTYGLLGKNVERLGKGRNYLLSWVALGFLSGGPAFVIIVVLWQLGVF